MMDFTVLYDFFVMVVFVACVILGILIKHATLFKWVNNNDIPVILAIFGGVLNGCVSGFSIETVVYGAMMGLASTGSHQAFKEFLAKLSKLKSEE